MTIDELKKGEHETVEYKLDIPAEKGKYLKTAVAFANAAGPIDEQIEESEF